MHVSMHVSVDTRMHTHLYSPLSPPPPPTHTHEHTHTHTHIFSCPCICPVIHAFIHVHLSVHLSVPHVLSMRTHSHTQNTRTLPELCSKTVVVLEHSVLFMPVSFMPAGKLEHDSYLHSLRNNWYQYHAGKKQKSASTGNKSRSACGLLR